MNRLFKAYATHQLHLGMISVRAYHMLSNGGFYLDRVRGLRSQAEADRLWIRFEKLYNKMKAKKA